MEWLALYNALKAERDEAVAALARGRRFLNPIRFLFRTFFWQPVPGWPRVSWRGAGAPDDAAFLVADAFYAYQAAFAARMGEAPPPVVRPIKITFSDSERTGHGNDAQIVEGKMMVTTRGRSRDEVIRLIGHERIHHDRALLSGDPDRKHAFEAFDDVPHMMTNANHRGWRRG